MVGHFPHGSSVRQTAHYGQIINAGQFQYYDYHNEEENFAKYGQPTPPKIEVETITDVPIAMFSGKYDRVVDVEDNREYAGIIPAVIEHNELAADHVTFLIGKDMSWFDRVEEMLDEYNPLEVTLEPKNWAPKKEQKTPGSIPDAKILI